jgi:hypothetical protein
MLFCALQIAYGRRVACSQAWCVRQCRLRASWLIAPCRWQVRLIPEYDSTFLSIAASSAGDGSLAANDGLAIIRAAVQDGRINIDNVVPAARPWMLAGCKELPFHLTAVLYLTEHKV